MTLPEYLSSIEKDFDLDCGLYGRDWNGGPGYHSFYPVGERAHGTRENLETAVLLLRSEDPDLNQRALSIIDKILDCQDTDPYNQTYGIWPWLYDEPLEKMAPPDWNWADFCGAMVATMLKETPQLLPDDLRQRMQAALGHAGWSIFRRNIQPGYTNIAIMGACVTAAAGELLDEPRLLDYAQHRIARFLAHTDHHGGLNEYNSPTYTFVALHECERILQLSEDSKMRAEADKLRHRIWELLSERFHPGTGQLAGPYSRCYADFLSAASAREIATATGVEILGMAPPEKTHPSVVLHLPCPAEFCPRFASLPQDECEVRGRFIRRGNDAESTWGTSWFAEDACLGSVNRDGLWIQRRPLLAYIRTTETPAVLKVEFLRNGKPCAAALACSSQSNNRALTAFQLVTNAGDHHIHLDRPKNAVYSANDLRIRYNLAGKVEKVEKSGDQSYLITVGERKVAIHLGEGFFDGAPVETVCSQQGNACFVDFILHSGEERNFPFPELGETALAAGLEILDPDEAPVDAAPSLCTDADSARWSWAGLETSLPLRPFAGNS